MYIDKDLLLDSEFDIGAPNTSHASTGSVDLGVAKNVAAGKPLYAVIVVDESFVGGTSVQFHVVTDTAADLSSPTYHVETIAILEADLTIGREPIVLPIGEIDSDRERYIGLYYTITGTHSAGKITTFITFEPNSNW
jgi:hypothetical protein